MNKPDDWLQHPYTQHLRREAEEAIAAKLDTLLRAAYSSVDPGVVKAVGEYRNALRLLESLQADKETKG